MAESSDSSVSNNVNTQKQKAVIVQSDQTDDNTTDREDEALLVEELSGHDYLPRSLRNLLDAHPSLTNAKDILVALVYILMLEEGFVPVEHVDSIDFLDSVSITSTATKNCCFGGFNRRQVEHFASLMPRNWKRAENLYIFDLVLKAFPLFVCRIVCTVCVDDLVLNCRVQGIENGNYSILVDPTQYVVIASKDLSTVNLSSTADLSRCVVRYQNVRNFAVIFKDAIANRARVQILHRNGVDVPSLQDLPPELVLLMRKRFKVDLQSCLS